MSGVIVVFPKPEDGKSIRNLLVRHGYEVVAVCTLGAQVLNMIDMMNDGIIISGYKYGDMHYAQLKASLPEGFDMLLLASPGVCAQCESEEIICISMPLKVQQLMNTLEMICRKQMLRRKQRRGKPKKRSEEEKRILLEAKMVLMEEKHMSEEEAHRYIQKCSMDSGNSLTEMAQMILSVKKG